MRTYIIKRLLLVIPTVLLVTLIVFFGIRLIPGTIIDLIVAQGAFYGGEAVDLTYIEQAMGLNAPLHIQYGRWIGFVPQADGSFSGIFQGDLGISFWRPATVLEEIAVRWPVTLELGTNI